MFENIDHTFNSILFLMDQKVVKGYQGLKRTFSVEKFSIINNFNVFEERQPEKASINLKLNSTFESFINFIDNYNNNKTASISNNKTYEFIIDFKDKPEVTNEINLIRKKETIKKFNLKYKVRNNFNDLYSSYKNFDINPYRILFKNRYSFPDFNQIGDFLLIISKKNSVLFHKTIEFFKVWTYQSIVYEMKNKILIYGYLFPYFNYENEVPFIFEALDNLQTQYKFLIVNKTVRQSTASFYTLPSSNQYVEDQNAWNLNKFNLKQNIQQKEVIFNEQIQNEMYNSH